MFGFLFYIWMGIAKLFSDIYDICKDVSCRLKTDNGLTYMDGNMCLRSSQTNSPVFWNNETGQLTDNKGNVYADRKWQEIVKRSKERKREAIEKGRSTFELLNSIEAKTYDPKHKDIDGCRYLDINTNKVYIVKRIYGFDWYVDIETGQLVRYTDAQLKRNEKYKEKWNNSIDKTNKEKEQKIIKKYVNNGYLNTNDYNITTSNDLYEIEMT